MLDRVLIAACVASWLWFIATHAVAHQGLKDGYAVGAVVGRAK